MSVERGRHWNTEIRSRSDLSHAQRASLVWRPRPSQVLGLLMYRCQHDQAPLHLTDHSSPVWGRFLTSSAFCVRLQQWWTFHATPPSQHARPSGVLCCCPDRLELTARRPLWSGLFCKHFRQSLNWRHCCSRSSASSPLEVFLRECAILIYFWHLACEVDRRTALPCLVVPCL